MSELPPNITFLKSICANLPPQKSAEWLKYREDKLTGSDMAAALKMSKFKSYVELLTEKCGHPSPFKGNIYTQWGEKYEDEAIRVYEEETLEKVHTLSILPHPHDPKYAFSPDGITEHDILIEVKCPYSREIKHEIPSYYYPQVQLGLQILKEYGIDTYAHFVQYRPFVEVDSDTNLSYHIDILRVERDDQWWNNIKFKIFYFWKDVEKYRRIGIERHPLYKPPALPTVSNVSFNSEYTTPFVVKSSNLDFREDDDDIDTYY